MKNYFLILFLCFTISAFGQIEKPITQGHVLIGGDFIGVYDKIGTSKTTQIVATPNIGYFIINNLALGAIIPIQYVNVEKSYSYISMGFGPYLKYYFNTGIFLSVNSSGSILNYKYPSSFYSNQSFNTKMVSVSPGIGYAYFLNNNVSLEGGVFYEYYKIFGGNSLRNYERNSMRLQVGFHIFL